MTDVYECEGQMSIYEFLDKEPEESGINGQIRYQKNVADGMNYCLNVYLRMVLSL